MSTKDGNEPVLNLVTGEGLALDRDEALRTLAEVIGQFQRRAARSVPHAMRDERRWLAYRIDPKGEDPRDGQKPPVDANNVKIDGTLPESWLTWGEALERAGALQDRYPAKTYGIGFAMAGRGGIDMDACRDPETGKLDMRADAALDVFCKGAYAEVSPSGKGVKVFGAPADHWLELNFSGEKVVPRRAHELYFTVTGIAVPGHAGAGLPDLPLAAIEQYFAGSGTEPARKAKVIPEVAHPGIQNTTMFSEMSALRRRGYNADEIAAAIFAMVESGRFPAEAGKGEWSRRDIDDMSARVAQRYPAGEDDFTRDKDGIPHKTTANIRRALRALDVRPRLNKFTVQYVVERDGGTVPMDDRLLRDLYYNGCERDLKFKPNKGEFHEVCRLSGDEDAFHPVRDYLDALRWDGVPRANVWLSVYAGARHTEYTKAVGRLVLMAAVRRVRQPGCKFDEMLVLESPGQGTDKSNLLRRLCPDPDWFSESLTLATDSKIVIERTSGIWIAEAAEMVGNRRNVDELKSFLSTSADGPVRLAYAREPVKVPRQFVVVGTTNHGQYLRDMTGGRRIWPVTIGDIDLGALEKDRDQLWAEAAHLEARNGASIRMDKSLWEAAGVEQEARRVAHPWEEVLAEELGDEKQAAVTSRAVWGVVRVPVERRTQEDNEKLGAVMRRLGFKPGTVKDRNGKVCQGYVRGPAPRVLLLDADGAPGDL